MQLKWLEVDGNATKKEEAYCTADSDHREGTRIKRFTGEGSANRIKFDCDQQRESISSLLSLKLKR